MDTNGYLRLAKDSDCDLIFDWANDEDERRNSFNSEKIKYEDHCSWYKRKLSSDDTYIYIYCINENPIGQVRIEIESDEALISYFISKENRGKGYGKEMLKLLKAEVIENYPKVKKLIARVKKDNIPSQKVFQNLGYEESCYFEYKL